MHRPARHPRGEGNPRPGAASPSVLGGKARRRDGAAAGSQAITMGQDQIRQALELVRSALQEVRVQIQRTAAEHDQMAAWYAKHHNQAAAWMERRAAAMQRGRLDDLDAALQALEEAVAGALDQDS